jgi:hypothetical protein
MEDEVPFNLFPTKIDPKSDEIFVVSLATAG